MATLLYPPKSAITLDCSRHRSSLQSIKPLQSSTLSITELPCLSSFFPSQSEKDFLLEKPYEKQVSKAPNMLSISLQSPLEQPVQRTRRSSIRSATSKEVNPGRAKHLERNRIAVKKCRLKKKEEHARMQTLLNTETAKRDCLLSEVGRLKDELWYLKNMIFEHAKCEQQSINNELARMTQGILESSSGQLKCPSPASSTSTCSDGSVPKEPGALEHPVTIPTGIGNCGGRPEAIFEDFIDPVTL